MVDGAAAGHAARLLTLQFLAWVGEGAHGYAEAMEAWRSSCPRLSIWEDAFADGLVTLDGAGIGRMGAARVVLTPRGVAMLAAAGRPTLRDAA
jgi:uncharacterized membrane protein